MEGTAVIEPVRLSVTVACPPEEAFRVFTERIGEWWPLETHSIAADSELSTEPPVTAVIEPREGGRLFERLADGLEFDWAQVQVWDPPHRLVLSWHPSLEEGPPTEIDVRFVPEADGTRVELEHRGWERLGDLGPKARESYGSAGGWPLVLGRYVAATSGA